MNTPPSKARIPKPALQQAKPRIGGQKIKAPSLRTVLAHS